MAEIDLERAVVLALDYTTQIVEHFARDGEAAVRQAARVCAAARSAGVPVIHVVPGQPGNRAGAGTEVAGPHHAGLVPDGDDLVFHKSTIGAFATTGLEVQLRRTARDTLIIMGVATSGTVLSTTRWGFDAAYHCVVVTDACDDPDPAVHAALTAQVHPESWLGLWRIADLVTTDEVVSILGA